MLLRGALSLSLYSILKTPPLDGVFHEPTPTWVPDREKNVRAAPRSSTPNLEGFRF